MKIELRHAHDGDYKADLQVCNCSNMLQQASRSSNSYSSLTGTAEVYPVALVSLMILTNDMMLLSSCQQLSADSNRDCSNMSQQRVAIVRTYA